MLFIRIWNQRKKKKQEGNSFLKLKQTKINFLFISLVYSVDSFLCFIGSPLSGTRGVRNNKKPFTV